MEKTQSKVWNKSSKSDKVKIDRIETMKLDKSLLPEDAVFKEYEAKHLDKNGITKQYIQANRRYRDENN